MQHLPVMQIGRRVLRAAICPSCYQRQPHDELLPPSIPRECESRCALFENAAVLIGIAAGDGTMDQPGGCDQAILKRICRKSCTRPTAGDYCVYWLNRTCPLARFGAQAVAVLQALPALHVLANQTCPLMKRCTAFASSQGPQHPQHGDAHNLTGHRCDSHSTN